MHYWVRPIVTDDAAQFGAIDPDRRDRIPAGKWRMVPRNPYWLRMAQMGDVAMLHARPQPPEIVEGEEPPPEAPPPEVAGDPEPQPAHAAVAAAE